MSTDENHEKKDNSNREDELKQLENNRSELVGSIKQNEKTSTDVVKEIEDYTDKAMNSYSKDQSALQDFGKKVEKKAVESLGIFSETAVETINSVLGFFRILFAVTISCLAIIGVVGAYLFHTYVNSFESDFYVTWGVLSGITIVSLLLMRKSIAKKPKTLAKQVKDETGNITEITSSRPQVTHDLGPIKRFTAAASDSVKLLAKNALEIVPVGDKIIDHYNKTSKQQKFVDNFIFALKRYNFDISDLAQNVMFSHQWLFDDENVWLGDVCNEVRRFYPNLDLRIFNLIYYEFFDEQSRDKMWEEVRNDKQIRDQISRLVIFKKLIDTPNEESSVHTLSQLLAHMPSYSLNDLRLRATIFFHDLAEFKESCIRHLDFYGLTIVKNKDLLEQYTPKSPEPGKWRDEIIQHIADDIIVEDQTLVRLLIDTAEGDQGAMASWKDVIEDKSETKLDKLASILTRKRITQSHDFDRDTFLKHLRLALLSNPDIFMLSEIETTLTSVENEILATKYRIQHMMDEFRLGHLDVNFVREFKPSKKSTIEFEFVNSVADMLKTDLDLLNMIFNAVNGLGRAKDLFINFVNSEKAKLLQDLLISKNFIADNGFAENTVRLLQTQDSFNLTSFVSLYTQYEAISEGLENLYQFLKTMGVCHRNPLSFADVLRICPVTNIRPIEVHLVKLANELVTEKIGEVELSVNQQSNLSLASTAYFLRTNRYPYSSICRDAARKENDFAAMVLFQCSSITAEKSMSDTPELLKEAVLRAINGSSDKENYEYFKSELRDGKLHVNLSYLFSQFKKEIKMDFKRLEDSGFEKQALENHLDLLRDLLYQQIDEDVAREFLLTQVLSAYLLTVPGKFPGIALVQDLKYIRNAEAKLHLEKDDKKFVDLVRLSSGGGKATRIGIVPFDLSFQEFSDKFEQVWKVGLGLYNEGPNEKLPVPLPCYLNRILPSVDGLKEIMPSTEIETKPLEVIRQLIREYTSGDDGMMLLSLLQKAPSGKTALLKVIQAIFDSPSSSLLRLTRDQIFSIVSKSENVKKKFERREIDNHLFKDYNVKRISELGNIISERIAASGEASVLDGFRTSLLQSLGDTNGITGSEVDVMVGVLFRRLRMIGIAAVI